MADEREVITDEGGHDWRVLKTLGAGGQGEVKLLADGEHAAKVIFAGPGARAELERRIKAVRRLPLDDLDVARPQRLLAPPSVGYVMRFLKDMGPLGTLMPRAGEGLLARWISTGGLRRRSRLLAHAGEVLHELHARGYVYGDVSPSNVFVSDDATFAEAWLIDPDNIGTASTVRGLFTPGYGAPELIRGVAGPDTLTDAHAFAVLVHQVLTCRHPWVGDAVADGEPELEDRARAGEFAWVDDPDDASNRSSIGVHPIGRVLTKRLQELCRRAFTFARRERTRRPSISEWVEALHEQADLCVDCRSCGLSLRPSEDRRCWGCDGKLPRIVELEILPWAAGDLGPDGELRRDALKSARLATARRVRCSAGQRVTLPKRLIEFAAGKDGRQVVLEFTADPRSPLGLVHVRHGEASIRIRKSLSAQKERPLSARPEPVQDGDEILLGPAGAARTLIKFSWDSA